MRVLITQISTFKKDVEATRCDAIRVIDKATNTLSLELCKQMTESKGISIVPYTDDADLLFQLGRIINANDTFVVGSLYSKLPKSVIAEYKIEQIGKKGAKKATASAAKKPAAKAPVKETKPKTETPKKTVKAEKPVKAEPVKAPEAPKRPRKKKGEDVSAYMESVGKYLPDVKGDDLEFVIRMVRECVKTCGDDRMAKSLCKSKLKKAFGESDGLKIFETLDVKFASVKSASGL